MQIFGHPLANLFELKAARPLQLESIELVADAATLRRLATFLDQTAQAMESEGDRFSHTHLLDEWKAHGSGLPDIVVSAGT